VRVFGKTFAFSWRVSDFFQKETPVPFLVGAGVLHCIQDAIDPQLVAVDALS
jgi:hypothetical protein